MAQRLKRAWYTRNTLTIGKGLLGKKLVSVVDGVRRVGTIIETECYIGPKDRASHAYNGKRTKRNGVEFLIGGHVYIYLVYGMYWQFNITTAKEDMPECVLIRALYPLEGYFPIMNKKEIEKLANGPGKMCRWMGFDKKLYGEDLIKSRHVWIEKGMPISEEDICETPRINIEYAGTLWAGKPWRFFLRQYNYLLAKETYARAIQHKNTTKRRI